MINAIVPFGVIDRILTRTRSRVNAWLIPEVRFSKALVILGPDPAGREAYLGGYYQPDWGRANKTPLG